MGSYQPQGSEKIQDPQKKWERIREMSGIANKPTLNENKFNTKFSTVLHEAVAADGKIYGLVQEGPKVYIKHLINDHYEYITGDEKDYAYKDFAQAFKHMNLLFKDISQQAGFNGSINLFEGGLAEKKNLIDERFVLKQPAPAATPVPVPPAPPADGMQPPMPGEPPQDPQATQQLGQEMNTAEDQMDSQDPAKAIQKTVGKLTEKMRSANDEVMTSEFMKSILNSVVSAIRVNKMEDADILSVIRRLKGNENAEVAGAQGGTEDFVDNQGVDYNVNNPANKGTAPEELKEIESANVREEITQPTMDDGPIENVLELVIKNVGVELNPSTENDIRNAVELFVRTYDSDSNQTQFMKQLQDYLQQNPTANDATPDYQMRYSSLSPLGQQVYDQLEVLDPSMNKPAPQGDEEETGAQTIQMGDSSNSAMGMAAESIQKSALHKIIVEALNEK